MEYKFSFSNCFWYKSYSRFIRQVADMCVYLCLCVCVSFCLNQDVIKAHPFHLVLWSIVSPTVFLFFLQFESSTLYNFSPCGFCSLHGLAQHILTEFNKDFQQRCTFISLECTIQTPRPVASSPFTGFPWSGLHTSLLEGPLL